MKVSVIMGSLSDLNKVEPLIDILKDYSVEVSVRCLSAHRAHDKLVEEIKLMNESGTEVIIAAAGMAAALPGVIAAMTIIPVIGIPISGKVLDGLDALLSIVQMPTGIPVACVAVDGCKNAAYLALEILGIKYPSVKEQLLLERQKMQETALKTNEELNKKY